jgi:two-component system, NarL family, sensor histidine kinase NreB
MLRVFPVVSWRRASAASKERVSPNAPFHTTLRSRAILLVALSALPPLAVMLAMATQWRRHEVLDAQARALELVRRASAIHAGQLQARDRTLVPVAHPVLDGAGGTDRVILRVFEVGWLREAVAEIPLPPGTVLAIFDNEGSVVAQHPRADARLHLARQSPLIQAAIGSRREGTLESDAFDGVRRTFAHAPLRNPDTGRDLFIAVGIPLGVATAIADRTLFFDFMGFGLAIVVGLIASSLAGERLVSMADALEARQRDALEAGIAERRRTQETLQKLSHVVDQTADSVFVTSRDGVIEYVNPAFEMLTGYSRTEAVGQTPRLFSSGLHDARFFQTLWATITAGRVFRAIVTNRARDGRLFDEDQTITPMRDDSGAITHFISTGRDITARKRTEQAVRRLNQQLEQETTRIANLLHDEAGQFLTSAHILLADLGRDLPTSSREQVQVVRRHLDQVEESLRTVSHDLHPRILTDLGLVGALRFRTELFTRRTGVAAVVQAGEDDSLPHGVEVAVYRLVQEALTNAGKYARASRVTIALARSGPRLVCSVQDDGGGFDPARAAAREAPALGIQNMRDRIEALGGTLEIVSRPGEGTLVRAVLPIEG